MAGLMLFGVIAFFGAMALAATLLFFKAVVWLVLLPIRALFWIVALPFLLLKLFILAIVGVAVGSALVIAFAGVALVAVLAVFVPLLPLLIVAGGVVALARLLRRSVPA